MIDVVISRNKWDYELSMHGHADYADFGYDIVCAAASAIAYTLLGYLNNCEKVTDIDTVEKSGDFEVFCSGKGVEIKTAFHMTAIGFLQMEKTYPNNVRVDVSGFR